MIQVPPADHRTIYLALAVMRPVVEDARMKFDVVLSPQQLQTGELRDKTVVVFDVLRATTTMVSALAAGVKEIHALASLDDARNAAAQCHEPKILCGEERCYKPHDFDLGNSPGAFSNMHHVGQIIFMATTNGTRAILSARGANNVFVAGLVNASVTAHQAARLQQDVILLCAATAGAISFEDVAGAGAVGHALQNHGYQPASDMALIALTTFEQARNQLPALLRLSLGGQHIRRANLQADIDFAARLDVLQLGVVGAVKYPSDTQAVVSRLKND